MLLTRENRFPFIPIISYENRKNLAMGTKTTYEQLIQAAYDREKQRMGDEFEIGLM